MYEKVINRTRNTPYIRQCWPLISKCDLDLQDRGLVVSLDKLYDYGVHLCQDVLNSLDGWKSYRPDTKYTIHQTVLTFVLQVCLTSRTEVWVFAWHIVLIWWTFVPSCYIINQPTHFKKSLWFWLFWSIEMEINQNVNNFGHKSPTFSNKTCTLTW